MLLRFLDSRALLVPPLLELLLRLDLLQVSLCRSLFDDLLLRLLLRDDFRHTQSPYRFGHWLVTYRLWYWLAVRVLLDVALRLSCREHLPWS